MIRIAVCDDEDYFRTRIEALLYEYMTQRKQKFDVKLFDSGEKLLEAEKTEKFDLIFLDINMEGMDGIETAKRIRQFSEEVLLVFVTAYVSYSPEGYKVSAIRYLLKDSEEFEIAFRECMNAVIKKIELTAQRGILEFQGQTVEVSLQNIIYVESNLHKLTFYIEKGNIQKYTMYEKLDVIEERFRNLQYFCRIYKSYLVNLKYVEDMKRYQAELTTGTVLNIAKPRYKDVERQYISCKGEI